MRLGPDVSVPYVIELLKVTGWVYEGEKNGLHLFTRQTPRGQSTVILHTFHGPLEGVVIDATVENDE